ncbi:zinc ABC transporter substrate-binding protein [Mycobacterium sp. NPDC050853]|uniref:metal ABC transporter solute-binding protein, Zn/Mn family n=1 Tax=Mycobacterium sp. NPDC050853 TaxID=3155160 RepID=UPI0033DB6838
MLARVTGLALTVVTIGTLVLAGCGHSSERTGEPTVVASTDVWASVAKAVVGDHATVSALVSGADTDPHSFEVSPAAATKVQDATVVVYNGGDYDPYVDKLLKDDKPRVNAYSLLPADLPEPNEHVFYQLDVVSAVADQLADELAKVDPEHGDAYHANVKTFHKQLDSVKAVEQSIATKHKGAAILATEPVAHYLVTGSGLVDLTPHGYAEAAENGTDPAPADIAAAMDLITTKKVAALLYNSQTAGPVSNRVKQAAESHGIPVVTVTETLPTGTDYITWQQRTAEQLAAAVG